MSPPKITILAQKSHNPWSLSDPYKKIKINGEHVGSFRGSEATVTEEDSEHVIHNLDGETTPAGVRKWIKSIPGARAPARLPDDWLRVPVGRSPWYMVRRGAPEVVEISRDPADGIAFHVYTPPPVSPWARKGADV